MSYQPPRPLDDGDRQELLRIVHVFAKEWLRSGRKPPGSPHRAALLRPSAAWLQLSYEGHRRAALELSTDEPLWLAMAHLGIALVGRAPSPTAAQLGVTRYRALVLGEPLPERALEDPAALAGCHLAVAIDGRAELVLAEDAAAAALDPAAQLAACCRAIGHEDRAWRQPGARVHAFPTHHVPLFSGDPASSPRRAGSSAR